MSGTSRYTDSRNSAVGFAHYGLQDDAQRDKSRTNPAIDDRLIAENRKAAGTLGEKGESLKRHHLMILALRVSVLASCLSSSDLRRCSARHASIHPGVADRMKESTD